MKYTPKELRYRIYRFLQEAMPVAIFLMLIFFGAAILGFQADNRDLLRDTKAIAQRTEDIVAKQDATLAAIEQLALDNKISGDQLKDILTCMLVVPIELRTPDVEKDCRDKAETNTDNTVQQQPANEEKETTSKQRSDTSPEEPEAQHGVIESIIDIVDNLRSK